MIGVGLALRQLWRSPMRSVLATLLLLATLTPLLLVWSLKAGQIDPLLAAVRSDPGNLEVALLNDRVLSPKELAAIAALPGLGYLEPTTRALSLRAYLSAADSGGREAVSMLPSRNGDPLLPAGIDGPELNEVLLTTELARAIGATEDGVVLSTSRFDGSAVLTAPLVVKGTVPPARLAGKRMLVHPQLISEIEAYLDGFAVPRLGATGDPPLERPAGPANARIYADRLESVVPLARALEDLGFFARVANGGIELALSLDAAAQLLVLTIGAALLAGAALGLWSGLSLCFLPQRRHVALLRLMGSGTSTVLAYVVTLGLTIGVLGTALSAAAYFAISDWLNRNITLVGAPGTQLSRLAPADLTAFLAASLLLALAVSLVFALAYGQIQPSGALRDEMS